MPNPYVIIVVIVAWLASLGAVGYWQYDAGETAEKSAWQERDNKQLRTANARILALEEAARADERQRALDLAAVSARYEKEKADVAASKDRVIADLRRGALRLRYPIAASHHPAGSEACAAAAGAGERDGRASAELPEPVAEFLVGLASEADEVVQQLGACQAVVRSDRSPAPEK